MYLTKGNFKDLSNSEIHEVELSTGMKVRLKELSGQAKTDIQLSCVGKDNKADLSKFAVAQSVEIAQCVVDAKGKTFLTPEQVAEFSETAYEEILGHINKINGTGEVSEGN